MPGSSRTLTMSTSRSAYEIPAASRASTVLSGSLGTNRMRPFPSRLIPSVASTAFRLTANQSRDLAVRQDLGRLAAEHERRNALATMRGHEDKVTALRPARIDDALVRVILHHVGTLARHPRRPGDLPSEYQIAFSPVFAVLLVLLTRVAHHHRVPRHGVKRRGHGHGRDRGVDRLCECDALADRLLGQGRAVGGNQDVLVHRCLLSQASTINSNRTASQGGGRSGMRGYRPRDDWRLK